MFDDPISPNRIRAARGEVARIALDVVAGSKDLFVGVLEIVALAAELDLDEEDEDLSGLLDVAAELEDLPIGAERSAWPRRLLIEADQEIGNLKRLYRMDLLAIHRRLAQRFAAERRSSP